MRSTVYEHILIASDGSDIAQNGVVHGLRLAKTHHGKVTAVTVTEQNREKVSTTVSTLIFVPVAN